MLHTSISAYANRNGTLMRLVASFPLLFTTSGDVLCLKFGGVWETLWIFKVVRWTRSKYMKINKSPTVSSGVRASSLEIQTGNFAKSVAPLPVGPQKPDIQMWTFLTWDFFMLLFFSEKNQNLLGIQEHCVCKLGKIRTELKLLFGVYYFLKRYTGIIWHSYSPLQGIS